MNDFYNNVHVGPLKVSDYQKMNSKQSLHKKVGERLIAFAFWAMFSVILLTGFLQKLGWLSTLEGGGLRMEPLIISGILSILICFYGWLILIDSKKKLKMLYDAKEIGLRI